MINRQDAPQAAKWRSNNFYAYKKNPQAKLSWVDPHNFVAMKSNVHVRYSTKLSGKSIDFNLFSWDPP